MPNKIIEKRKAYHLQAKSNELYVQRKTNLNAYLKRIESLLENRQSVIILHGLGAAILKTVQIANIMQNKYHNMELIIDTSTQNVIDKMQDGKTQIHQRSAIHIKLVKNIYD